MKSFILLSFADDVKAEHLTAGFDDDSLRFKDFQSDMQEVASGFDDLKRGEIPYVYDNNNNVLRVLYRVRKRTVPAHVINEAVENEQMRLESIGLPRMKKKEVREYKENIKEELLPRAYPKDSYMDFYFDIKNHVIYANVTKPDTALEILAGLNRFLIENDMPTLNVQAFERDIPFSQTFKNLLFNRFFSSNANDGWEFELNPIGNYVIKGNGEMENSDSKIRLDNVSPESDDLFKVLSGVRYLSSIGLRSNNDATFNINEDLVFSGVKLPAPPEYQADRMSFEDYLKSAMLFNVANMNHIYNSVVQLLKLGHQKYGETDVANNVEE